MKVAKDGESYVADSQRSVPQDGHRYESHIFWRRIDQ